MKNWLKSFLFIWMIKISISFDINETFSVILWLVVLKFTLLILKTSKFHFNTNDFMLWKIRRDLDLEIVLHGTQKCHQTLDRVLLLFLVSIVYKKSTSKSLFLFLEFIFQLLFKWIFLENLENFWLMTENNNTKMVLCFIKHQINRLIDIKTG